MARAPSTLPISSVSHPKLVSNQSLSFGAIIVATNKHRWPAALQLRFVHQIISNAIESFYKFRGGKSRL
jgi:hypothetical protein